MISIVIPTYNSEKYLTECLKSIFSQSYKNFEVIVIDAYSTDNTNDILKDYLGHHNKLHIIRRLPHGEPDAINYGMEFAKGDIVTYIDADDTYEPDCFAAIVSIFESQSELQWLYGIGNIIDSNGNETRSIITTIKRFFWPRYNYRSLQCLCYIVQPTVFMRRTFYSKVGMFNEVLKYVFDYHYWLRASKISKPMFVNWHLANWRAHSNSISVKEYKAEARQALEVQSWYSPWYLRPVQYIIYVLTVILYKNISHGK